MADNEIKTFNVKNTSVRVVHIGGIMLAPDDVRAIVDDEKGINRADVESSDFLEITDEDPTEEDEAPAPKAKSTAKAKTTTAAAKTPTGAGWSSK
jgi:hypothetical protein